jgi:membrane protease YdiL (CAAX protease family)
MGDLVAIATFSHRSEADVPKMLLEQNGIRAFLADDNLIGMDWFLTNAVGGVKLLVAAEDVERARAILQLPQASDSESEDAPTGGTATVACSECGQSVTLAAECRGHTEDCPKCHEYIDVPCDAEVSPGATCEVNPMTDSDGRTNRQLWMEVIAVFCLTSLPVLYSGLSPSDPRPRIIGQSVRDTLYGIVFAVHIIAPVLLIMALSKDRWSLFGIVRPNLLFDVTVGCIIWMCAMFFHELAAHAISAFLGARPPATTLAFKRPESASMFALLSAGIVVKAFCEELVCRGYFIPKFERLLSSRWMAVVLSAAIFASGHLYQGPRGIVSSAVSGLVYGTAFCMTRRLWPVCIAHIINNALILL